MFLQTSLNSNRRFSLWNWKLLQKPHLQSLMCAHDAVAQKDFYPHLPDIPIEVDEDEETIKIVQLVKSNEPLVSWDLFAAQAGH